MVGHKEQLLHVFHQSSRSQVTILFLHIGTTEIHLHVLLEESIKLCLLSWSKQTEKSLAVSQFLCVINVFFISRLVYIEIHLIGISKCFLQLTTQTNNTHRIHEPVGRHDIGRLLVGTVLTDLVKKLCLYTHHAYTYQHKRQHNSLHRIEIHCLENLLLKIHLL